MAGIAADLGVELEDLDFADLTFYHGGGFPIEMEFEYGSVELSSVLGASGLCFDLRIPPVSLQGRSSSARSPAPKTIKPHAVICGPRGARRSPN